ncbi:MAG: glycolate oxidase subunit GlcF [Steroidobacteraceae bacterium]
MQTKLSPEYKHTARGIAAEGILRSCVHCGFCNATCPTYQLLGDELDGPRGRIYLIKELLEGSEVGRSTQLHLDRCLTCLNCETTCPSGVRYGELVGIGRELVEERVPRPPLERFRRWSLKEGLHSPLFAPLLAVGRRMRALLPAALRTYVPRGAGRVDPWPEARHERKVLLLAGCVQPALFPNINRATARVLDAAGIQTVVAAAAGCCGALRDHLSDHAGGLEDARRNIDAWWPWIEAGTVDAIIMNASACGLAVKNYGAALHADADYGAKARRVSDMARDLSELLPDLAGRLQGMLRPSAGERLIFHAPCTLQHGQRQRDVIETHLAALGFDVGSAVTEPHLCCGSAGTYSVLMPAIARQLRDRKLAALAAAQPSTIISANVGCIQYLQSGTDIPVRHWVEILDEALAR